MAYQLDPLGRAGHDIRQATGFVSNRLSAFNADYAADPRSAVRNVSAVTTEGVLTIASLAVGGEAVVARAGSLGRGAEMIALTDDLAAGKFVPNPYGRLGGPAHRSLVAEIATDIRARGLIPETEFRVLTPGGLKGSRYVDVVALDPVTNLPVEFYQVGRQTLVGKPVAREAQAIQDIQLVTNQPVIFRAYNN